MANHFVETCEKEEKPIYLPRSISCTFHSIGPSIFLFRTLSTLVLNPFVPTRQFIQQLELLSLNSISTVSRRYKLWYVSYFRYQQHRLRLLVFGSVGSRS